MVVILTQAETKLCRFRYEAVKDLLQKPATVLIFLGVERREAPSSSSPSTTTSSRAEEAAQEAPAWFAIGTDEAAAELLERCQEKNCSFPKTPNRDLLKLSEEEAGEEDAGLFFIVVVYLLSFIKRCPVRAALHH